MTTLGAVFNKKLDDIQHQLDMVHREDTAFTSHTNKKLEAVFGRMATKEDIHEFGLATKADTGELRTIVLKIAENLGVSM